MSETELLEIIASRLQVIMCLLAAILSGLSIIYIGIKKT